MEAEIKGNNPAAYPAQYDTEVVLTDGSAMILRPIKPEDAGQFLAFSSPVGGFTIVWCIISRAK